MVISNTTGTGALLTISALIIALLTTRVDALIIVGKGSAAVADNHWPAGSLPLANLTTRIGWSEGPPFGGGQHRFAYHGTAADFQNALDLFSKIESPKRKLVIHDGGPTESPFLTDDKTPPQPLPIDWEFTVWNPESWKQLYSKSSRLSAEDPNGGFGKDVEPPSLDVYVGTGKGIDISHLHFPANVDVTDERADMNGFKDGSAIVGDVIDLATGKPIVNATVELASAKAYEEWEKVAAVRTDAQGHYQLTKAPKGNFGLLANADGYAPRMLGYVTLRGNTYRRFPVRLAAAVVITGVAVDQNNKPAVGVTIRPDSITSADDAGYILPKKPKALTDAQGHFVIAGLPAGHVQIFAYGDHFLIADALAVQAVPSADLKIRVVQTGACKGRVIDAAGKPDARGNIRITPEGGDKPGSFGGSGNVAPDGTFAFENVPPGKYTLSLQVTNPGPAATIDTPIVIEAGKTTTVDLKS